MYNLYLEEKRQKEKEKKIKEEKRYKHYKEKYNSKHDILNYSFRTITFNVQKLRKQSKGFYTRYEQSRNKNRSKGI